MKQWNVGIFLFDDVEVLDFAGPYEVFSVTAINRGTSDEWKPFQVTTFSETGKMVKARNGLQVIPDHSVETIPKYDILVIPGGLGTRREIKNEKMIHWLRDQMTQIELMTSVCTGAFLLAQAGLLHGKQATTHRDSISILKQMFPKIAVQEKVKYVDQGNLITSAGISAGIQMSLHIIQRILSKKIAISTAEFMEYDMNFT